jgi:uncharacterized membrane protein YphA (DoxX/SURF4 family)
MTLENIKLKNIGGQTDDIIRIFLALVFLTAGIFRIFNFEIAVFEFAKLHLFSWLSWPTIILEIGAGLSLLFNKYTKYTYRLLVLFLIFVLSWALLIDGGNLLKAAGELFIFNLNPTDFFLHFVFLLLIVVSLLNKNK